MIKFNLQDTFNKELPADPNKNNTRRQVKNACFSWVRPKVPSSPKLIHVSDDLLHELGLEVKDSQDQLFTQIFSGAEVLEGTQPYSMCYGGHQFGSWAGQLGDGRAINLFEIEQQNKRWVLQLKGAGETPYSRSADGLAVLRSSIREHLCSEAMYHLGVPTTRSLSLILSGDEVLRDIMYDGHAALEKGAIVCRVAPSFIRFGNFQIFAAQRDRSTLKKLTDYTIKYFFPEIKLDSPTAYLEFFKAVQDRTIKMIIEWQRVGFVHGVMNTDNLSILGLTIDYGPYGWLEDYNPNWTPNTTDRQNKRYRFGFQPAVAHWNLYQLANALVMLVDDPKPLEDILKAYPEKFKADHKTMMLNKLGLSYLDASDDQLIDSLQEVLQLSETDMTIFYRELSKVKKNDNSQAALEKINFAFYKTDEITDQVAAQWLDWLHRYIFRLSKESKDDNERRLQMNLANPKYVLRNYMAQLAIDKAEAGDYGLIDELYQLLKHPYTEQEHSERWYEKRPDWARHKIGCSMLSCSS